MIQPGHPRRGDARGARLRAPCAVAAAGPQKTRMREPTQPSPEPKKTPPQAIAPPSRAPNKKGALPKECAQQTFTPKQGKNEDNLKTKTYAAITCLIAAFASSCALLAISGP